MYFSDIYNNFTVHTVESKCGLITPGVIQNEVEKNGMQIDNRLGLIIIGNKKVELHRISDHIVAPCWYLGKYVHYKILANNRVILTTADTTEELILKLKQ